MGNAKTKKRNQILGWGIGGGIAAVVFIALIAGGAFAGLTNPPTDSTGDFSVVAWDGGRGIELPSNSFTYKLYGVEGNDLTDFGMYDTLESGTSLGDISTSDLDTDYDQFVVEAEGLVLRGSWDEEDEKVEPIDEKYDHAYYTRWFVLNTVDVNYLVFYETPSVVGLNVLDSQTFAPATGPVSAKTNLTIIVGTNASQPFARYVTGANYANENNDAPEFVVNFNYDVALSDVLMAGATKTRVNSTALRFQFGVLSTTPSFFNLIWSEDLVATTQDILEIKVWFGGVELAEFD